MFLLRIIEKDPMISMLKTLNALSSKLKEIEMLKKEKYLYG